MFIVYERKYCDSKLFILYDVVLLTFFDNFFITNKFCEYCTIRLQSLYVPGVEGGILSTPMDAPTEINLQTHLDLAVKSC